MTNGPDKWAPQMQLSNRQVQARETAAKKIGNDVKRASAQTPKAKLDSSNVRPASPERGGYGESSELHKALRSDPPKAFVV